MGLHDAGMASVVSAGKKLRGGASSPARAMGGRGSQLQRMCLLPPRAAAFLLPTSGVYLEDSRSRRARCAQLSTERRSVRRWKSQENPTLTRGQRDRQNNL